MGTISTPEDSAVYIKYEPMDIFETVSRKTDMFHKVMNENSAVFITTNDEKLQSSIHNSLVMEMPLLYFNQKNRNGRIYTKESIKNFSELIKKSEDGRLMGELGYPSNFDVSLNKVSHVIEKIWEDDDKLMGRIKILNTPSGRILQDMIISDCEMVFRPRSSGVIDENGVASVKTFTFDAIAAADDSFKDIVKSPSSECKNIL